MGEGMLNYGNLNDVEFEYLCQDVMTAKLGVEMHRFAPGRDGGIDLRDGAQEIMVQVKHYYNSSASRLISSLEKELDKVKEVKPKQYYVCCSKQLTPQNVSEIYNIFKDYMKSADNILTLNEIDGFLSNGSNTEILKRHHKLWIAPHDIIQTLNTYDIDIDSWAMTDSVESDVKLFVQTQAYRRALAYLLNGKSICIIGDPGVGKSLTSKMLAYYFIKENYRLRYTTDGMNLSGLKRALSQDPKVPEIIVLDDCFGQVYFNMKDTQENELLSLIKYINSNPNKLLIINSRVTIFNEATNRTPELFTSMNKGEYMLYRLNLDEMSDIDKALILYNHLYFSGMATDYFAEIKKNKRYMSVINHRNYNPRIIEYVCNCAICDEVPVADYYRFVVNSLDNPNRVWRDEYERRLNVADRILLTTLYSLTSTSIPIECLRYCFDYRIGLNRNVDVSVDRFKKSLVILEKSTVKIADNKGVKSVAFANPSIVDFLGAFLQENTAEARNMIDTAVSVRQLKRMLPQDDFERALAARFRDREIENMYFSDGKEKRDYIVYYIAVNGFTDAHYRKYVLDYIKAPCDIDVFDNNKIYASIVLIKLFLRDTATFYGLDVFLSDVDNCRAVLNELHLDDLVLVVNRIYELLDGAARAEFSAMAADMMKDEIGRYCTDVSVDVMSSDIDSIINCCMISTEDGEFFDEERAVEMLETEIMESTMENVRDAISALPDEIQPSEEFLESVDISVYGAAEYIDDYMADAQYDPELMYDRDVGMNEIDLIFK